MKLATGAGSLVLLVETPGLQSPCLEGGGRYCLWEAGETKGVRRVAEGGEGILYPAESIGAPMILVGRGNLACSLFFSFGESTREPWLLWVGSLDGSQVFFGAPPGVIWVRVGSPEIPPPEFLRVGTGDRVMVAAEVLW